MIKKRKLTLFPMIIMSIFLSFYGCNVRNTIEDISGNVNQGTKKISEDAKDIVSKIKDNSMKYSKEDFKNDLKKKGITTEKTDSTRPYFSVPSEDYKILGGSITIYEYKPEDKDKIISDLKTITENGTVINGTKISWLKAPHLYKKGRIVVIYDGDNESILTNLKDLLGNSLLG